DGLADMQKRGGFALKQVAMRAAYENLKTVARDRQCFGMSLLSGDRIMAIFPGTPPARLSEFGNALVEYSRAHPIQFTGLYREDAPAKPEAAAPAAETEQVQFVDEDAGARLKSRESLDEEAKAPEEKPEEGPEAAKAAESKPEVSKPEPAKPVFRKP